MENIGLSDSLFSALRKYPKSQELDPIENFLTEGFAWLLRNKEMLAREFVDYLSSKLPEPLPLTHKLPEWKTQYTFPAKSLQPNLKNITLRAAEVDWRWVLERIGFNKDVPITSMPAKYQYHSRRLGLEILDVSFPSIFVGTLLDGSAFNVQPSNLHLGPDFCLILGFNIEKWKSFERDFFYSDEYTKLRSRLKENSRTWDFHDHKFDVARPNPWHPLHLRKPLVEVFRGTITFEQQVDRFILYGREVIELLLAGGELEALTNRLHPIAKNSIFPVE